MRLQLLLYYGLITVISKGLSWIFGTLTAYLRSKNMGYYQADQMVESDPEAIAAGTRVLNRYEQAVS